MVKTDDYYAVIGVDPNASFQVIRAAYRALAQRHHPDRPNGSTERMIAINQAWSVLRDTKSRAAHDRSRTPPVPEPVPQQPSKPARPYVHRQPAARGPFEAGPLMRRRVAREPESAVLDFGRYAGWTVAELAQRDPNYLAWLATSPAGRSLAAEIKRALAAKPGGAATRR